MNLGNYFCMKKESSILSDAEVMFSQLVRADKARYRI